MQKEASGSKTFTVNISLRPLYIPHKYIILQPGSRIGDFIDGNDKWWSFKEEFEAEESFKEVSQILNEKVLPMFDILDSNKEMIQYFDKDSFPIRWYTDRAHGYYYLAYVLLREHKFEEAINTFNKAYNLYKTYKSSWSKACIKECEEVIKLCIEEKDKVDEYLEKCEQITLKNLKIDKNLYAYEK